MNDPDYSFFGDTLRSIGGWHVGCINHKEYLVNVNKAKDLGLVTTRMHYAPVIPEGGEAFELTDAGIEMVGKLCGDDAKADVIKQRQWYRDNAAKYQANR